MATFIGEIILFSGPKIPQGFLPCDGRELLVRDYQALYSIILHTYGGVENKTFRLPDLRGRSPIGLNVCALPGFDRAVYKLGQSGGTEHAKGTVKIEEDNLPAHDHQVVGTVKVHVSSMKATKADGGGHLLALPQDSSDADTKAYIKQGSGHDEDPSPSGELAGIETKFASVKTGKGQPLDFDVPRNPYFTVRYLIAAGGGADVEYPAYNDDIRDQ